MALQSVANEDQQEDQWVSSPNITEPLFIVGESFCVNLGVIDHCEDAESFRRLSSQLQDMANAVLHVANIRGENDSDLPETFKQATTGAQVLLQFGMAMQEAATRHEERQKIAANVEA